MVVRASWLLLTHQRQNNIPSDEPLCSVTPGKITTAADMTSAVKQQLAKNLTDTAPTQ